MNINFLTIEKHFPRGGITITDSITENKTTYYGYTLAQAIKKHRRDHGLEYKHFTKIYI
jgi:hypothetical protein